MKRTNKSKASVAPGLQLGGRSAHPASLGQVSRLEQRESLLGPCRSGALRLSATVDAICRRREQRPPRWPKVDKAEVRMEDPGAQQAALFPNGHSSEALGVQAH